MRLAVGERMVTAEVERSILGSTEMSPAAILTWPLK